MYRLSSSPSVTLLRERINKYICRYFWAILCIGLLVHVAMSIGLESDIRISLFDILLFFIVMNMGPADLYRRLPSFLKRLGGCVIIVTLFHSLLMYIFFDITSLVMLGKDTVKMLSFPIIVLTLVAVFLARKEISCPDTIPLLVSGFAALVWAFLEQYLKVYAYNPKETVTAVILFMFVLLLIRNLVYEKKIVILPFVIIYLLCFVSIMARFDLEAFVVGGYVLLALLAFVRYSSNYQYIVAISLGFLAILIAGALILELFPVSNIYHFIESDKYKSFIAGSSVQSRLVMWDAACQWLQQGKIFGAGLGQMPELIQVALREKGWHQSELHNTILSLLVRQGVFSLPVIIALVTIPVVAFFRMRWPVGFAFMGVCLVVLTLHDILGLRSMMVIYAVMLTDIISRSSKDANTCAHLYSEDNS